MNIGQVSNMTGLQAKTIRYYEEIGLVRPLRRENGYRSFSENDAHKLIFLARARALGFAIEDCRDLLELWENKNRASGDVRRIAVDHLAHIDAKIANLKEMRQTLSRLVDSCRGDNRPDCPILKDLGPDAAVISQ